MFDNVKIIIVDHIICPPDWSWESQKNGWMGYHIWYLLSGGAIIKVDEKVYQLNAGDIFLFDLNKNHICTHDPNHPLQVATIYFQENDMNAENIKRYQISNDKTLGEMILRCNRLFENHRSYAENYLKSILVEFLFENKQELPKPFSVPVKKICDFIDKNRHHMYSLDEMSLISGYSKNQIIRLFRNDTGMTPIQYQMGNKMQYASQMLLYSDKTINEIAFETGIEDVNYFSKIFKKYTGKSPRNYRNYYRINP